ncbi:MAG: hypothetical protein M1162_05705 [Candidatus Thermoplasmatota archaeon]|nr:hypothetical protein [Candidatus Thermoplasmatota archaeon]
MNGKITAVIVVLVILVVVFGALYVAGVFNFNSKTTTTNTNNPGAANVVSASTVSKSYGGTWSQTSGSSGKVSNSAGLSTLLNATIGTGFLAGAGHSPSISSSPALSDLASVGAPSASSATTGGSLQAFEMGLFAPNSNGFAFSTVGFLEYSTAKASSSVFGKIFVNVTNMSSTYQGNATYYNSTTGTFLPYHYYVNSFHHRGLISGDRFVFTSSYNYYSYEPKVIRSMNESVLLGQSGQFLVYIVYFSAQNQTLSTFENLFQSQANAAASVSTGISSSLVSGSTLSTDTSITWTQDITMGFSIHNPSKLVNEYIDLSLRTSTTSISSADRTIINETAGNITGLNVGVYSSGNSTNLTGLAAIGFVQFKDQAHANTTFNFMSLYFASDPYAGSGMVGGHQYFNISSRTSPTAWQNILAVQYNQYIVFEYILSKGNLSITQLKSVASSEISVA